MLQLILAIAALASLVDYVISTIERLIKWFRTSKLGHIVKSLTHLHTYMKHAKIHGVLSAADAEAYRTHLRLINDAGYKAKLLSSGERKLYNEAVKMEEEMEPYLPPEPSTSSCSLM
ncbi:hypothetical protein BGZ60DRAFT_568897 [Tricladium varicosporioides]|nr:hypothetical protein BGZ60DRAFT_568897 [Hymenoscyphus varicosporioides]